MSSSVADSYSTSCTVLSRFGKLDDVIAICAVLFRWWYVVYMAKSGVKLGGKQVEGFDVEIGVGFKLIQCMNCCPNHGIDAG